MNRLILDIETLPADKAQVPALQYLFKRKLEKRSKKKELLDEVEIEGKIVDEFSDYHRGTSFDGGFGRVLCIAYAINNDPVQVICNPDDEKATLVEFWTVAKNCDLFIGHNVMDFDLRFLYQRSIVLGVRPSRDLSFARYRNAPIFDTMKEWSKWSQNNVGLEHVALALGIPTPKEGVDGSEVYDFYLKGKVKDICDYCMRDVETTRAVYKKMVFEA